MADLAAVALAEGYYIRAFQARRVGRFPSTGYYFRILDSQGASATGGSKNYMVDGKMTHGFAVLAYPAKYRSSGVMTFLVGSDGIIYERDLGPATASPSSCRVHLLRPQLLLAPQPTSSLIFL